MLAIKQIRVVAYGHSVLGRDILRGVVDYKHANACPWRLHTEMSITDTRQAQMDRDDGAILAVPRQPIFDAHAKADHPVVNCLAHYEPMGLPTVRIDDQAVGRMAAEHLLELGHTRIFFTAGNEQSPAVDLRWQGFCEVLAEADLKPTPLRGDHSKTCRVIQQQREPVALFCTHDGLARLICQEFSVVGIGVPEPVAVMGADNDLLACEVCEPPLTSIELPYRQVGFEAARRLHEILEGDGQPKPSRVLGPLRVVGRQSTDAAVVADERLSEAVRFIRAHACDPCDVAGVVDHVAVSRSVVERLFRQHLDTTPHDLIVKQRMRRATYLLRTTSLSMAQVARQSGYVRVQDFGRAFKKATDQTPAAYRQTHRTNPHDS